MLWNKTSSKQLSVTKMWKTTISSKTLHSVQKSIIQLPFFHFYSGMKTRVQGKFTCYAISRTGYNAWSPKARNIFRFTAPLLEIVMSIKIPPKREAFNKDLNQGIFEWHFSWVTSFNFPTYDRPQFQMVPWL